MNDVHRKTYYIVLVTAPKEKSKDIARLLVEKRLAACINIIGVQSIYWWENRIEESPEDLLIIKTQEKCLSKLFKTLKEIHPYEVPEILSLEIHKGYTKYLEWIDKETNTC